MEEMELTLEKCQDIAHTYELSQAQAEAIRTQATPKAVDALYSAQGRSRFRRILGSPLDPSPFQLFS